MSEFAPASAGVGNSGKGNGPEKAGRPRGRDVEPICEVVPSDALRFTGRCPLDSRYARYRCGNTTPPTAESGLRLRLEPQRCWTSPRRREADVFLDGRGWPIWRFLAAAPNLAHARGALTDHGADDTSVTSRISHRFASPGSWFRTRPTTARGRGERQEQPVLALAAVR